MHVISGFFLVAAVAVLGAGIILRPYLPDAMHGAWDAATITVTLGLLLLRRLSYRRGDSVFDRQTHGRGLFWISRVAFIGAIVVFLYASGVFGVTWPFSGLDAKAGATIIILLIVGAIFLLTSRLV